MKLAESLLTEKHLKLLGLKPCTAAECAALKLPATAAGFVLPYFDLSGKPTKFFRYRYLEETRKGFALQTDKKPLRYGQPASTVNEVYFPPLLDWRKHLSSGAPVILTEGELKAACATSLGLPTIGLGGVWCFMSKRAEVALLPQLAAIDWKSRLVVICYDSDAVTNPDVVLAEGTLARRLLAQGAVVRIARIPTNGDRKVGLDDYLAAHGAETFKTKVLAKAFEFTPSAALHDFNVRVVYIHQPGIVYSYERKMMIAPAAFVQHAYANEQYEEYSVDANGNTKVKTLQTAAEWLKWPGRAELTGITYAPGQSQITDEGKLNTWPGWGVTDAVKGDVSPWKELLDHLFGEEKAARTYFERWCAYPIQHPGAKMAVAAALWGSVHGSGKTMVGHVLMRLYGENATEVKDHDLQSARFEWAENKQFVLADDITGDDNRKVTRRFMTMITQSLIRLDIKYVKSFTLPDCINYYFTANDPDLFHLDDDDRRFFIWECLCGKLPVELRNRLLRWRDSKEGKEALMHYLLTLPLGDFDPQAEAMVTDAKTDMQLLGKSDLGAWVARLKESPDSVLGTRFRGDLFTAEELHLLYDPLGTKRASANALSRELKRAGFRRPATGSPLKTAQGMRRVFVIRNPDRWTSAKHGTWNEACKHYDEHHAMVAAEKKEKF